MKQNSSTASESRLSKSRLIYFGLPDYAVYLAAVPVSLYLPFVYSKDLGLDLADIGLILMVARISDALAVEVKENIIIRP